MKAEYIDHMGDDLRVVNAARVSFDKESDWCKPNGNPHDYGLEELREADKKLINFLAREEHWTPFAHCVVTLRETVPIFVARQRFKHTVGFVYNEVSRRYVSSEPEFYTPSVWRKAAENVKQGSSDEPVEWQEDANDDYRGTIYQLYTIYKIWIDSGMCPEQARMILPQSMYTSYYVTGSLAAWARAYKLRSDSNAQKEIQDLAQQWDEIIRPLFPHSWEALTNAA